MTYTSKIDTRILHAEHVNTFARILHAKHVNTFTRILHARHVNMKRNFICTSTDKFVHNI